jgi:hypothetical protein
MWLTPLRKFCSLIQAWSSPQVGWNRFPSPLTEKGIWACVGGVAERKLLDDVVRFSSWADAVVHSIMVPINANCSAFIFFVFDFLSFHSFNSSY